MKPMIIPGVKMYDRIDEITEYLDAFPNGAVANALRKELAYLEAVRDHRLDDARRLRDQKPFQPPAYGLYARAKEGLSMSLLFIMAAAAVAASVEERVDRLMERLRAPRLRRARQYKFN